MEKCATCRFCEKLYVPPVRRFDYANVVKDKYVCTACGVMYIGNSEGRCEMYSERTRNKDGK